MSNNNANQLVQQTSARAIQLVNKYYEALDSPDKRPNWVKFYMPDPDHPLLIWNGHILPTAKDVEGYARNLPKTKHNPSSIDAQPIMGSSDFVVTIQGTVTYGDNHRRRYFQRITATKKPGTNETFISSDYLRWTGEA